ncbi:Non-reducing polyketide synthase andM [Fusarium oxysporum f. sp. rapae]|uniref:Non-reducing polyketide synthase andM n=1 Tax=Fusarium oxysporum f. sp. rapae TaxID=485398 RepID=A0A8J5TT08_FUSOX|nr:Non-reducing polyketide synthase andM [Fusarium oxysporum f. sp. rapae]
MRVFITSRPELHIRLGFRAVSGSYQEFILHDVPEDFVKRDIQIFFTEKLKRIRKDYNILVEPNRKLPDTWPGPDKKTALVEKAVPLFVFAATVCRFISQRRSASPDTQLQRVLAFKTGSQEAKMNAAYLPTLEQQLEDLSSRERDEVIENFQQVVGTITLLETPLTVPALSRLIDALEPEMSYVSEGSIHNRLDVLHSVLNYPKASDCPGTNRFWVDEKEIHGRIAAGYPRILNTSLKEDICNQHKTQTQTQDHGLNVFEAIDGRDPARSLAEATAMLWKNGISDVQFWPFHKIQRVGYSTAVLPLYQFEKNRHWLDYTPHLVCDTLAAPSTCPHCSHVSDFPYMALAKSEKGDCTAKFKVDPRSRRY